MGTNEKMAPWITVFLGRLTRELPTKLRRGSPCLCPRSFPHWAARCSGTTWRNMGWGSLRLTPRSWSFSPEHPGHENRAKTKSRGKKCQKSEEWEGGDLSLADGTVAVVVLTSGYIRVSLMIQFPPQHVTFALHGSQLVDLKMFVCLRRRFLVLWIMPITIVPGCGK